MSAVVSGEKNPYVSKALELKDKSNKPILTKIIEIV